jgi:hypothetical protein
MKIIIGDILKVKRGIILHQVNCIGATGGLAGALRRQFPSAFFGYLSLCESRRHNPESLLGTSLLSELAGAVQILHVFGQTYPGPNTCLPAVRKALGFCDTLQSAPIYAPYKMGCGLGGGDWKEYSKILEELVPDITIIQKP